MSLLEQIKKAGIVGAGGAGFPTHVKLDCKVDYLLINAAECEPLLDTDKYIIRNYADHLISAVKAAAKLVAAKESYIAVKGVNKTEIAVLEQALAKKGEGVSLFLLDNYYPAGDEQMVVYDITGRIVPPGGIPLNVGVVVSNAATMLQISEAMRGLAVTHKYLTVTGYVKRPMVLKVPVGALFSDCIDACGGALLQRYKVINGGPMMGKVSPGDRIRELPVTKTTSGIILLPDSGNSIARQHDIPLQRQLNRAKSACIQCNFCTDLCPRQLIGHKLRPHMIMRHMAAMDFSKPPEPDNILKEALICCECGLCETYACPMNLSPRQINQYIKHGLAGQKYENDKTPLTPSTLREYRKVAPKRILSRMGLGELYGKNTEAFKEVEVDYVKLPLKQHIGVPADPIVENGDYVSCGQLIAKMGQGKMGADIHASISGVIEEIGDEIVIRKGAG